MKVTQIIAINFVSLLDAPGHFSTTTDKLTTLPILGCDHIGHLGWPWSGLWPHCQGPSKWAQLLCDLELFVEVPLLARSAPKRHPGKSDPSWRNALGLQLQLFGWARMCGKGAHPLEAAVHHWDDQIWALPRHLSRALLSTVALEHPTSGMPTVRIFLLNPENQTSEKRVPLWSSLCHASFHAC